MILITALAFLLAPFQATLSFAHLIDDFRWQEEFERDGPLEQARAVEIAPGATLGNVSDLLEHNGIIRNRWVFWIGVKLNKQERNLKAGEYLFPAHASMKTILDAMVSGRGILYSVSIPEGLTSQQIVDRLNAEAMLDGSITAVPKEGALLPETYKFTRGDTRQNILNRMMRERDRVVTEIWNRRADGLPIGSVDELVTLASIVEKETGLSDERSHVASVFINRLNRYMRLQSDPTVIYGIYGGKGKPADKPITRSDLDARNAYNTYQIDGLPPGPIANPGIASLEAVANPSRTADLYFVSDGSGGHAFAASFAEHQRNVERWQAIEAKRVSDVVNVIGAKRVTTQRVNSMGLIERKPSTEPATMTTQKAMLFEESMQQQGAVAASFEGTAVWRTIEGGPDGPVVEGTINVPDRKLHVQLTIRRNSDTGLPASHLVEIAVNTAPDHPGGGIAEIPRLVLKTGESSAGQPIAGAAYKVVDGLFWIALSNDNKTIQTNMGLLRSSTYMDIPLMYKTGQRAILTLAKGEPGTRAFERALATWESGSKPPDQPPLSNPERRIALVIGNGSYRSVPRLPNPPRDASLVAEALKKSGIEVTLLQDGDRASLVAAIQAFGLEADHADWAIIYFAGHGIEIGGINYLVPIDARLRADRDIPDEAVSLDRLLSSVERARKLRVIILDACRNNPFTEMKLTSAVRAVGRGLARVEAPRATLIAFSAKAGSIALDGDGPNSPFASAFARRVLEPGVEINKAFRLITEDVLNATGQQQQPFVYQSLPAEDLFFVAK